MQHVLNPARTGVFSSLRHKERQVMPHRTPGLRWIVPTRPRCCCVEGTSAAGGESWAGQRRARSKVPVNLVAVASNLLAMASNLRAMASNPIKGSHAIGELLRHTGAHHQRPFSHDSIHAGSLISSQYAGGHPRPKWSTSSLTTI